MHLSDPQVIYNKKWKEMINRDYKVISLGIVGNWMEKQNQILSFWIL